MRWWSNVEDFLRSKVADGGRRLSQPGSAGLPVVPRRRDVQAGYFVDCGQPDTAYSCAGTDLTASDSRMDVGRGA